MSSFKLSYALSLVIAFAWQSVSCLPNLAVVNGDEVVPHSLPYMTALESVISGRTVRCGGSLISKNKVLTAASCIFGAKNVTITLGAHNLEASEDTQVRLQSSNFSVNDGYDPDTRLNDIAIINLPQNVSLTDAISTISTPPFEDILETFADDLGVVAGWGKANDSGSAYSPVLRKIEATVLPFLACTIPYLGKVKMSQICTTGIQGGQNICLGDAGSPLVVNGTQVGIASYGSDFGCAVGLPGVYTRLTSFYFWLTAHSNA